MVFQKAPVDVRRQPPQGGKPPARISEFWTNTSRVGSHGLPNNFNPGFPFSFIQVDNTSGAWLYLPEPQLWVPPNTLGWRRQLFGDLTSISGFLAQDVNSLQYFPGNSTGSGAAEPIMAGVPSTIDEIHWWLIEYSDLPSDNGQDIYTQGLQGGVWNWGDSIQNGSGASRPYLSMLYGLDQTTGPDWEPVELTAGAINVNFSGTGRDDTDNQAPVATGLGVSVVRNYIFDGTNWDRWLEPTADGAAVQGFPGVANLIWNGATWDRLHTSSADALAATGLLAAGNMLWNGATWDRIRGGTADALAVTGILSAGNYVFNRTTNVWDRISSQGTDPLASAIGTINVQPILFAPTAGSFNKAKSPENDAMAMGGLFAAGGMLWNGATWDRRRSGGVTGAAMVDGDTPSGTADAGNPVKTGGYSQMIESSGPIATIGADARRTNVVTDRFGAVYIKKRYGNTWSATFRAAARPYLVGHVFAAAGRFQYATMHMGTGNRLIRFNKIITYFRNATAAADVYIDLVRSTLAPPIPATGNPAIVPTQIQGAGATQLTCLTLPTTQAAEAAIVNSFEVNSGVTGAATVIQPVPTMAPIVLWDSDTMGDLVLYQSGGYSAMLVVVDSSAASTINLGLIWAEWTEDQI